MVVFVNHLLQQLKKFLPPHIYYILYIILYKEKTRVVSSGLQEYCVLSYLRIVCFRKQTLSHGL